MGQTTPAKRVALPEQVQEAIKIAQQKVQIYRDEEVRLSRSIGALEKEVAALDIKRETIEGLLPDLEKSVVDIQVKTDEHKALLEKAKLELSEALESRKSEEKARDKAVAEKEAAKAELSLAVGASREAKVEMEKERAALAKAQKDFEDRKKRIGELLARI
jgi:peptidoglycan hydrolase CwlO-like protein|tara:strand:+ start:358 stop:840 length:483 start_codon:yes stop_codon:yes gene_type:complete